MKKRMPSLLLAALLLVPLVSCSNNVSDSSETKGETDTETAASASSDESVETEAETDPLAELYAEEAISMDEFRELRAKYDEQIKRLNTPCADTAQNNACNLNEMLTYADKLLSGELWDDTFYRCVLESAVVYKNRIQITLLGSDLPVDVYFK